jgi:hypothetical protein
MFVVFKLILPGITIFGFVADIAWLISQSYKASKIFFLNLI